MKALLHDLAPKMLGDIPFEIFDHGSKPQLLLRLPERLRGYASFLPPTWRIVVVLDRDADDCRVLKQALEDIAEHAGLVSRTRAGGKPWPVVHRIAIEELEAWFFGDWDAVRRAYPRVPETIPRKAKYRDPDAISGGTWEAFLRVLQDAGYFPGGLRKIEAVEKIAPHMNPVRNGSRSFQALRAVLAEFA